ncbi:MAG: hypothetical protein ACTS5I_17855 [Rhodanobacter sp.]
MYKPEYADQVEGLCKLGATDEDIAEFFDVVPSTVNLWKQKHPEFSESIKKGKTLADIRMAEALYATGLAGDTTAQIFWLKNRQRKHWTDTRREELSGPDGKPIEVNNSAADEIARRIARLAERSGQSEGDGGTN